MALATALFWCAYPGGVVPCRAQTVTEPRISHLQPIVRPSEAPPTGDRLTVRVVIGPDGTAQLDDPDLAAAWFSSVQAALEKSRFEPARVDGRPVPAVVRVRFSVVASRDHAQAADDRGGEPVAEEELEAGKKAVQGAATEPGTEAAPEPVPEEEFSFGATARTEGKRPDLRRLETVELRELPGAFGDPFRALETLPGVAPFTSGLPYVYVRGAPPAGTLFIYDDIALPTLFHLGLGPAVVHPAMIGPVEFYSSVGPARYGRRTGGLFTSAYRETDERPATAFGELELRAIDLMGMGHGSIGPTQTEITAAGRYGYPGLLLSIFSPDISLAYWDYQLRLEQPVERSTRMELVWFGSYDSLSTEPETEGLTLTFHRLELRLVREQREWEYGTALLLGYDESSNDAGTLEDAQAGEMWSRRIGPRLWLAWQNHEHTRWRLGADMVGMVGELSQLERPPPTVGPVPPNLRTSESPPAEATRDAFDFAQFDNPVYTSVAARSMLGAYAEYGFRPAQQWDLELGLRSDLWITGHKDQVAVDPRLLLTHYPADHIDVHAAAGLAHQPAVFLLPLPGVSDVALDRGMQEAVQTEVGAGVDVVDLMRAEVQLFLHYYTDLLFPELAIEKLNQCDPLRSPSSAADPNVCESERGFPRASALAYGAELFVRRPIEESLSGWLSYTLAWAKAESEEGFTFTPVFDMRHVANTVLQYELMTGWRLGIRLHLRSGKMFSSITDELQRIERRLPPFFRLDAQTSYGWRTGWGQMRVSAEWFNVTLSREARSLSCGLDITDRNRPASDDLCEVEYAPAFFFPNVGLRAEF